MRKGVKVNGHYFKRKQFKKGRNNFKQRRSWVYIYIKKPNLLTVMLQKDVQKKTTQHKNQKVSDVQHVVNIGSKLQHKSHWANTFSISRTKNPDLEISQKLFNYQYANGAYELLFPKFVNKLLKFLLNTSTTSIISCLSRRFREIGMLFQSKSEDPSGHKN